MLAERGGSALILSSGEPSKPNKVQGVVVVHLELLDSSTEVNEGRLSGQNSLEVQSQSLSELNLSLLGLLARFDESNILAQSHGSKVIHLLVDSVRPDMEVDEVNRLVDIDSMELDVELVLGDIQVDRDVSGDIDEEVLINTGGNKLIGEGADGSNKSSHLGGIQSLHVQPDRGQATTRAGVNGDVAAGREGDRHVDLNNNGETHVRGNAPFRRSHVHHSLEVQGLRLSLDDFHDPLGVLQQRHDLFLQHLSRGGLETVEHGRVFKEVKVNSTLSHSRLARFDLQLLDNLVPFLVQLLLDLLVSFALSLLLQLWVDEFHDLLNKVVSTTQPQSSLNRSELIAVQVVDNASIHVRGDEGILRISPRMVSSVANSQTGQVLAGVERSRSGESSSSLLDQGVNQPSFVLSGTIDLISRLDLLLSQGKESSVDNLQNFRVLLPPGASGNSVEDRHVRVHADDGVEGSNSDFSGLSRVAVDRVQQGANKLGVLASNIAKSIDSKEAGQSGILTRIRGAQLLDVGNKNGDDTLVVKEAKGDNDGISALIVLRLLQLLLQVGNPLVHDNLAVRAAEVSENVSRVAGLAVLGKASLLDELRVAQDGVVVDEGLVANILRGDQAVE